MEGTVDLHGLYVAEAVQFAKDQVQTARSRGKDGVRFIVGESFLQNLPGVYNGRTNLGKGLHADDGKAKIRPALEDHFTKYVR